MPVSHHQGFWVSWHPSVTTARAYLCDAPAPPRQVPLKIPHPTHVAVRRFRQRMDIAYSKGPTVCHIKIEITPPDFRAGITKRELAVFNDIIIQGIGYSSEGIVVLADGLYLVSSESGEVVVRKIATIPESPNLSLLVSNERAAVVNREGKQKKITVYEIGKTKATTLGTVTTEGEISLSGKYLAAIYEDVITVWSPDLQQTQEKKWRPRNTSNEQVWWTDGTSVIISACAGALYFFLVLPLQEGKGWGRVVGYTLEAISVDDSKAGFICYCAEKRGVWAWNEQRLCLLSPRQADEQIKDLNQVIQQAEMGGLDFLAYGEPVATVAANIEGVDDNIIEFFGN